MASLKYFLIRTVLFVVPFAIFMALGIGGLLSAVYAVLIAFAISYLFLRPQRDDAVEEVRDVFGGRKQVRTSREVEDAEAEDALTEEPRTEGQPEDTGTSEAKDKPEDKDKPEAKDKPEGQGKPEGRDKPEGRA